MHQINYGAHQIHHHHHQHQSDWPHNTITSTLKLSIGPSIMLKCLFLQKRLQMSMNGIEMDAGTIGQSRKHPKWPITGPIDTSPVSTTTVLLRYKGLEIHRFGPVSCSIVLLSQGNCVCRGHLPIYIGHQRRT